MPTMRLAQAARECRLTGTVTVRTQLAVKAKRQGSRTFFLLQKIGDSFHRLTGRWHQRTMVVDRENDRYREVIVDAETGEAVHRCEEPLSQHQGHGGAKAKKMNLL